MFKIKRGTFDNANILQYFCEGQKDSEDFNLQRKKRKASNIVYSQ